MTDWVAVVPVKRFAAGKSRLEATGARAQLAEAIARDTLATIAATPRVRTIVVVTDDPALTDDLRLPVAAVVLKQTSPGLNGAISDALKVADTRWPDFWQAVLPGDLPAMTPSDLDETLANAEHVALGLVRDSVGTGTVLITAKPDVPLLPMFGPDSGRRHADLGHRPVRAPERVRRDVDTVQDLQTAVRLGVGPHTSAVLRIPRLG